MCTCVYTVTIEVDDRDITVSLYIKQPLNNILETPKIEYQARYLPARSPIQLCRAKTNRRKRRTRFVSRISENIYSYRIRLTVRPSTKQGSVYFSVGREWDNPNRATPSATQPQQSGSMMDRWMQQKPSDEPWNSVAAVGMSSGGSRATGQNSAGNSNATDRDSLKAEHGGSTRVSQQGPP